MNLMKCFWGLLLLGSLPFLSISQTQYPNLVQNTYLQDNIPPVVLQYVNKYLPVASKVAEEKQVPVDFLLAVAGLETGWGQSELCVNANNHFGIKNFYNDGPSYCMMHADYVQGRGMVTSRTCFKRYTSPRQSFLDYIDHLESKGCYLDIEKISKADFSDWVRVVAACGYATDPNYAQKIKNIREKYYFTQIIPRYYLAGR
jgi:flagellum-specific peptidoglycan hydrolase FlgJ